MKKKIRCTHTTRAQDQAFLKAWRESGQNVLKTAEAMGLSRQAIYNRLDNAVPDCYYIVPVDERYYQAVAVSYVLKRMWIATGKMSSTAAERFAESKRAVETITYTERSGKIVTVPKYMPKVVFVTEGGR